MFFVRSPRPHPFFQTEIQSPPMAYWLMQSGSEKEDDKTVLAANKEQGDPKSAAKPTADVKRTAAKSKHFFLDDFEVIEEDGHVVLSTDLPGIKHADLKVEFRDAGLHVVGTRKQGTKKQSFIRRLAMDEDIIDVENLTATLEDGILTVKAPKAKQTDEKEGEPRTLVVTKTTPPVDPVGMSMEIDMPGVKVEDLKIVVAKNGLLSVVGERKSGSSTPTKKTEAFMLNTREVDTSKLEAYLIDGVLTIRAPAKVHKVKIVAVNGQLPPTPQEPENKTEEDKKQEE